MARTTGKDVINLSDKDFERKKFKTAPAGTYFAQITRKTKIAPGRSGNILKVHAKITKGPQKGISFFDNIAPHVGWKIAQLLHALGTKKMSLTLQQLFKMILDQDLRVILRVTKFESKDRNEVVQWLPLKATKTDDDDEDEDEDDEENEDDADEDSDEDDDEDTEASDDDDEDDDTEVDDDDTDDEDDDDADDGDDSDDDDDDEEDDVDEDEEEEETPPARGRRAVAAKKTPAKAPAKKAARKRAAKK